MTKQTNGTPAEPGMESLEQTEARLNASAGKGRPTPTRKEREAANKRPLVPNDRKEAAKQARAQMSVEREKARVGLANGEERYLPIRDRGPQKKFVRDFVDARFSAGEWLMPLLLLVVIASFIQDTRVAAYSLFVVWGLLLIAILDCVFLGLRLRRKLTAKYGYAEKGVRWYAAMRALQMRFLRLPKPQVRRRQYPQ
ncbi:DUF3043 domain-containing protein [Mycetocola lacteus]|uniref:DUF3043 domain-containing protein n=2 Tax=Microbacteriaceae TaxID=85023 RepID=A0A3L7AQP9_9MICO|nr:MULTISPECIES: DUF3043 domain-containing protein [Mycetocola]MCS4276965.1 hypothetical protein [Mycetocola sp. BIGb0189]RLP82813.1 DUF3043 domain-containing protein [Mycetocola lacteus]